MLEAIVGLNWGDEGKGRMVDYLAARADCVVRFQGGDNAGHTIVNDLGRFVLHSVPSAIFRPRVVNVIASGSVVNPQSFGEEISGLAGRGIDVSNLLVSTRAILILPFHQVMERLEEERLGDRRYGSTLSGIAPTYGLKYLKKGIQAGELLHTAYLRAHLAEVVDYVNLILRGVYGSDPLEADDVFEWAMHHGNSLRPYLAEPATVVRGLLAERKRVLVEGQLGALRDITHGIYPFTTSSSTLAANACVSIPLAPRHLESVVGVTKAYSTCVGAGPFVTEMKAAHADKLRTAAGEYGAKTGRPRRIGHFDAVATRYGCWLQGATAMAVTCLDILTGQPELKICTAYDVDGRTTHEFPGPAELEHAVPVYETMSGWSQPITGVRRYQDLPRSARDYIERLEELCDVPIQYVSVGPHRESLIERAG